MKAKLLLTPCFALTLGACTSTSHPLAKVADAVSVSLDIMETTDGVTRTCRVAVPAEQGKRLAQILARTKDNEAYQPRHVVSTKLTTYRFTMPDGKEKVCDVDFFTPTYEFSDAGYDTGNGIYLFQTEEDKRDFQAITDNLLRQLPPKSRWKREQ